MNQKGAEMIFRNAMRVIVMFAATAALAQSPIPANATPGSPISSQRPRPAGQRGPVQNRNSDPQGLVALRQQVEDFGTTVSQMHAMLKQMHARAAKSTVKDSLAKSNLEMWDLMVAHLDKELQNLRVAVTAREDLEARRAALYKQADAKAEAEAQAARAAQAARFAQAAQGGGQNPAGQNAADQPLPTPPASSSPTSTPPGQGPPR